MRATLAFNGLKNSKGKLKKNNYKNVYENTRTEGLENYLNLFAANAVMQTS